jgi:hypothetical protein
VDDNGIACAEAVATTLMTGVSGGYALTGVKVPLTLATSSGGVHG